MLNRKGPDVHEPACAGQLDGAPRAGFGVLNQPRSGRAPEPADPHGSASGTGATSQARMTSKVERTWLVGTYSSRVWARDGSPGPKLTAGITHRREPRDVGPAVLRARGTRRVLQEGLRDRLGKTRTGTSSDVDDSTSKPSKMAGDMGLGKSSLSRRGEPVVHR